MLKQSDFISAVNSAIKQAVEEDYEKYKEQCVEDLKRHFDKEKNDVVRKIMDGIDVLVQETLLPGELNVRINIQK